MIGSMTHSTFFPVHQSAILLVIILPHFLLAAPEVEMSQSIINTNFYQLTCRISSNEPLPKGANTVHLHCPALDSVTDVCFSNCSENCNDCGLNMVSNCKPKEVGNPVSGLQFTYIIDSKLVKVQGDWSCSYRGKQSRKITLSAYEQKPPPELVTSTTTTTTKIPPLVVLVTSPTTATPKGGDGLMSSAPPGKKTSEQPDLALGGGGVTWLRPPQPGIVYALIVLLALSALVNIVFIVRCCLIQRYITQYRLGYEKQNLLETILCLKRRQHSSNGKSNSNEVHRPQLHRPNGGNNSGNSLAKRNPRPTDSENCFAETGHLLLQSNQSESSSHTGAIIGASSPTTSGATSYYITHPYGGMVEYSPHNQHQFNSIPRHMYRTPLAPALPIVTGRQFSVPQHTGMPLPPQVLSSVPHSNMEDFQSISTGSIMMEDGDSLSTHSNSISDRGLRQQRILLMPMQSSAGGPPLPTTSASGMWPMANGTAGRPFLDPNWMGSANASPAHLPGGYLRTTAASTVVPVPPGNLQHLSVIEEGNTATLTPADASYWREARDSMASAD